MPQASDAQRAIMQQWFGHDTCDAGPMNFLLSHGYTEEAGLWRKPTPSYSPSIDELECLCFLRDEWDYDFEQPLFPQLPSDLLEESL